MQITNKLGLPEFFIQDKDHEYIENRYSVTELLKPAMEINLTRKYDSKLTQDISEQIPALIGTAVHSWLEVNNMNKGEEQEVKFEFQLNGVTIVGIIDVLNRELKYIVDYKTCSVSKIQKEDFDDWYKQGMIYAYGIYKLYGIKIEKVKFLAMMKDWSKIKSYTTPNYPKSPVYIYEFNVRDTDFISIREFLDNKIKDIKENKECSDKDMWYSGDVYAVYKNENDLKANKLFNNFDEAQTYIQSKLNGTGKIEYRKGEYTKCKYYCACSKYCERFRNAN